MEIYTKKCVKCGKDRKFLNASIRDITGICGNCWDWNKTEEENIKLLPKSCDN